MARRFLLYEKEESSMVSSWTDSLHCSILKNGTISLRLNKHGGDGSWWVPAIRNIQTPKQFIETFRSIDYLEHWYIADILPALHEGHPVFAILVEKELKLEETEGDTQGKIQDIIDPVIKRADLDLPSGITNKRVFVDKVREYVKIHLLKTGSIPIGEYQIQGRKVKFRVEKEKNSRKRPRQTKIDRLISEHVEKAIWSRFEGRPYPQWANASRTARIKTFVKNYWKENGKLPIGKFDLQGFSVEFPNMD